MQITFNKQTALAIIRSLRSGRSRAHTLSRRSSIAEPDPSPRRKWSAGLFRTLATDLPVAIDGREIDVAVSEERKRLRTKGVSNTIYSGGLPKLAFVDVGGGIRISCPELVFIELADSLNPVEHLMLGHELCGTFSRDALDPYNGPIAYDVKPVTSVERIARFLEQARYIRGIDRARKSLEHLNDNAWSPTESLVAALLCLPIDSLGYDLGTLELNPRKDATRELPGAKGSRVPDIMVVETGVGVNYDGLIHLDLNSIAKAAIEVGTHPELSQAQAALDKAMQDVRAKALDDIRRNRELAASGLFVFPLIKEDLYTPGGLDAIAEQLMDAIEQLAGRDMSSQRRSLRMRTLCEERYRVILSLLPGKSERHVRIKRFIEGHQVIEGPLEVHECWIEL